MSDSRSPRKKKHSFTKILVCLLSGYAAGRTTIEYAMQWASNHMPWLSRITDMRGGVPSVSTAWRVIDSMDKDDFCELLSMWEGALAKGKNRCQILDGKGYRAAASKIRGERVPYILNAIDAQTNLIIGQVPVGLKTNEKSAIHTYLDLYETKDNIILIDAIGTDQYIIKDIAEREAAYVLQVKKNNPATYETIMDLFLNHLIPEYDRWQNAKEQGLPFSSDYMDILKTMTFYKNEMEKNRERIEYRYCWAITDSKTIESCCAEWESVKTLACMKSVRIPVEKDENGNDITVDLDTFLKNGSIRKSKVNVGDDIKDDVQYIGIVSNKELSAREMALYKRLYWTIEDCLHHVADNCRVLAEDKCTARGDNRIKFGLLRGLVFNLHKVAQIIEYSDKSMVYVANQFCDNPELIEKYLFHPIKSFA